MKRLSAVWMILCLSLPLAAQSTGSLPRSTPEAQGVSSAGLVDFLDAVAQSPHELHSVMVVRHGYVVAEGWWSPYRPDLKHMLYSTSKSFTATAVGFAVAEKKLTVDDKVIDIFPEDVPETISAELAALRVRDLLSMSVGHGSDPTWTIGTNHDNWVKAFLATPIVNRPGSKFLYNSMATYMLSAIVQKVTGEKVIDYLGPRLFAPLGIEGMDWETDPRGINSGGWGLRLKTEDMAKFGQLFLQKGVWQGRRLLPESWIDEASSMKIEQDPGAPQSRKDSNDWLQGYCYQMWRCRHNGYRADGAYGQFIIMLPDEDAVVAITAETGDMQSELNLVWDHILPAFHQEALPADPQAAGQLKERLAGLALKPLKGGDSPLAKGVSGKRYRFADNDQKLQGVRVVFEDGACRLTLVTEAGRYRLRFGAGQWLAGETTRLGPNLVGGIRNSQAGLPPFKVAGSYGWEDDQTLALGLRYVEGPHTEMIRLRFNDDKVELSFNTLFNKNNVKTYEGLAQDESAAARLIVRGDDMGYTQAGNEALAACYRDGIEQTIEVMAPTPWFPQAVAMLKDYPGVDVGVHLTLTSEWDTLKWRPLTDCPSLMGEDGYFYPFVYPNTKYPGRSMMENGWKIEEVEREFRAQIERTMNVIPQVSHLSAHMGCSGLDEEVKALTERLARDYGIRNDIQGTAVRRVGYDGPSKTSEEKIQSFMKMLTSLEPGQTYLFLDHPGLDTPELRAVRHVGYDQVAMDRQGVTDMFTDKRVKALIEEKGIELIGYDDLE